MLKELFIPGLSRPRKRGFQRHHIDINMRRENPDRHRKYLMEDTIYLTFAEHCRIHKKGVPLTEKNKAGISKSMKGVKKSPEHCKKLSEARKKNSSWNKGIPCKEEKKKALSKLWKGCKLFNNGIVCVMRRECPEGFVPGRINKKEK